MMDNIILLLGALGLVLTAGGVLGLVLETLRRKEEQWALVLAVSGVVYLLAFVTEPPAAWAALWQAGNTSHTVALRSLTLGVFMAALCRAYIHKCRDGGKK